MSDGGGRRDRPLYDVKYVFGLGNPGRKYKGSRHNAGFDVVDVLAERYGIHLRQKPRLEVAMGDGVVAGVRAALCEPQTFMNVSGYAVSAVLAYLGGTPADLIVVYDDIDLPFGAIRIREKGSAGTHNGMRSIVSYLHTQDFVRVRIGIGQPDDGVPLTSYVLGKFADEPETRELIERGADAVEMILHSGVQTAQRTYHVKREPDAPKREPQGVER